MLKKFLDIILGRNDGVKSSMAIHRHPRPRQHLFVWKLPLHERFEKFVFARLNDLSVYVSSKYIQPHILFNQGKRNSDDPPFVKELTRMMELCREVSSELKKENLHVNNCLEQILEVLNQIWDTSRSLKDRRLKSLTKRSIKEVSAFKRKL